MLWAGGGPFPEGAIDLLSGPVPTCSQSSWMVWLQEAMQGGEAAPGAQHQLEHALQARHTGPGSAPKLGSRSISMELPSMSAGASGGRGVTWKDATGVGMAADHAEDIGGSKARRGAYAASKALALEAELSSLDREVMHHLRKPSGGLPGGMADEQVPDLAHKRSAPFT